MSLQNRFSGNVLIVRNDEDNLLYPEELDLDHLVIQDDLLNLTAKTCSSESNVKDEIEEEDDDDNKLYYQISD